jgi:hypothetical protein
VHDHRSVSDLRSALSGIPLRFDDVGAVDFDLVAVASGPAVTHLKYRPTKCNRLHHHAV